MTRAFISYAHEDEFYSQELDKHLSILRRTGYIDTWTDRKIAPGEAWSDVISEELLASKIILLLVSADFLAADNCYENELKTAVGQHNNHEALVIPIMIEACNWKNTLYSGLHALPSDGKPLKEWEDMDQAFLNVVEGIKVAINGLTETGEGGSSSKFGFSAEEQFAALSKRAQSAQDARDFRLILFDINQFKIAYPQNSEIEELEARVKNGLSYETHTTMPTRQKGVHARKSTGRNRIILLLAVALVLALCAWLIWRFR